MQRVLVTGGTGMLGRVLVPKLQQAGYTVRVMSRKPRPENFSAALEWVQADVLTGEGLDESVRDVDVVIHGATSPFKNANTVEVAGTRNMLEAARDANSSNFIYVSIVGIDRTPYPYYRAKLEAEHLVETFRGNVSWTILRATQFYELMDNILSGLARFPVAVIDPQLNFQPVDVRDVSAKLVEYMGLPPQARLPDFAGPQISQLDEMMRTWLDAKRMRRAVLKIKARRQICRRAACGVKYKSTATLWKNYVGGLARGKLWTEWEWEAHMTTQRLLQILIAVLGVTNVAAGLALLFAPQWFFENIGTYPPFNRHYEGDAGAFLAAIGFGLLWAARDPQRYRALIGVALISNALHLINHLYDDMILSASFQQMMQGAIPVGFTLLLLAFAYWLAASQKRSDDFSRSRAE